MVLPDDALGQHVLQVEHGVDLVALHLADGDARPAGDHRADRLAIDHDLHERVLALQHGQLARHAVQLAARPRALGVVQLAFELRTQTAGLRDQALLLVPALLEAVEALLLRGPVGLQRRDDLAVSARRRFLASEHLELRRERVDPPLAVLERGRRRGMADGDARRGGVEHVDRLVRQLAAGDVAARQLHGCLDRLVEDPHAVVLLEGGHQPPHHHGGRLVRRFLDLDHLEAPFERGVLLEVLLVFRPRGGGDGAQQKAA